MDSQVPWRAGFAVKTMATIATSNLHILILFVWIVSVLTSPVNTEVRTDGASSTSAANPSFNDTISKKEQQSLLPVPGLASEAVGSTKIFSRNESSSSFAGEGGPISISSTIQSVPPVASHLTDISTNPNANEDVSKRTDDSSAVTAKSSSQPRISPRKGANPDSLDIRKSSLSSSATASNNDKSTIESSGITKTTRIYEGNTPDVNNGKADAIFEHKTNGSSMTTNVSLHDTNISQQVSSTTSKTLTTKKHKPKPTVTIGEPGIDKPIPASPTKSSPLGMPRKIDYIIPVVITIIALPLLGAATFMLYRQGRDCWDKRHYRRMDFLIDGMYND